MTRRTLFSLGVLASGLLALTPASVDASGGPPPKVVQVSSDPFTNIASQHATEVEAQTLGAGSTFVAVFQAGRFFAGGGSSAIAFAASQNAGAAWTCGVLPILTVSRTPPGTLARASRATVAFDAQHGVWLVSSLACQAPRCLSTPDSSVVSRATG